MIYTLRARNDLDPIYRYLDERSSIGAQSVKRAIERRISRLADFPLMGPATEEPGVHELTIIRYPYKVYYRIEENEVRIVHIRHTARRTPETSKC